MKTRTRIFIIAVAISLGYIASVIRTAHAADLSPDQQRIAQCSNFGRVAAMFNNERLGGASYENASADIDRAAWDVDYADLVDYRMKLHNVLDFVYSEAEPLSRVIDARVTRTCLTFNRRSS